MALRFEKSARKSQPVLVDNRNWRASNPEIEEHFKACEENCKTYPLENGRVSDQAFVEEIDCPICAGSQSQQAFLKWGFQYDACPVCSHVFVKNRLREDILMELYQSSKADELTYLRQKNDSHNSYWTQVHEKYSYFLQEYFESIDKKKSLLDVGCGAGEFLKTAKKVLSDDWSLWGSEFCESAEQDCREILGERFFYQATLEDIQPRLSDLDVITFWGVMEHLANPSQVLKDASSMLNENGLIFILIPNLYSAAYDILGVNTPTINPREHINFFTPKSMEKMASTNGLRIIHFDQELPVIDLMYPWVMYDQSLVSGIVSRKRCYYHVYFLSK